MKAKRLVASFLAVCMLVMACSATLMMTAFATVADASGANITIVNDTEKTNLTLANRTFNVYEVFTATLGGAPLASESNYQQSIEYFVSPSFLAFFIEKVDASAYTGTAAIDNTTFNQAAYDYVTSYTGNMAELVKQMRTYALGTPIATVATTGPTVTTTDDTVQSVTTSGDNLLGYYLVLDSADSLTPREDASSVITAGALVTVPTRDQNGYLADDTAITIKGSGLTIDKEVWHNDLSNTSGAISPEYGNKGDWSNVSDYEIGDTVEFRLTAGVPASLEGYEKVNYDNIADATFDYTYVLTDTPSDGINIDLNSIEVFTDANLTKGVEGACHFVKDTGDGGFEIIFDMVTIKENFPLLERFYIYYTGEIDETANVTHDYETNTITLEYSTNAYEDGDTTTVTDTVYTYTFDLDVFKTKGDGTSALDGATFALYYAHVGSDSGKAQIYLEPLKNAENKPVITEDGAVVYYVTNRKDASDVMPETGTPAGTILTGSTGKFSIIGLDDNVDYVLKEIDAPEGYNAADPISFTIRAEYITDTTTGIPTLTLRTSSTSDIKVGNNNILATTVINTSSALLPTTGGMGTTMLTYGGIILMVGAATAFIIKRKKS